MENHERDCLGFGGTLCCLTTHLNWLIFTMLHLKKSVFLLLFVIYTLSQALGQAPTFVKDFNLLQKNSEGPTLLGKVGNILYFTANDGINGRELWRTDGTESGTYMVKDITPGPGSTTFITAGYDPNVNILDGKLYFGINAERDIWITDGTQAGTVAVINGFHPSTNFFVFKGKLYYHRINNDRDWDMYSYSPANGEELVHNLAKDVAVGTNYLYFLERSNYSPNIAKLYRYDGTTKLLLQTYTNDVYFSGSTVRQDDYYFTQSIGLYYYLFKYNSTTNTITTVYESSYYSFSFKWVGSHLYIIRSNNTGYKTLLCCPSGDCTVPTSLTDYLSGDNILGEVQGKPLFDAKNGNQIMGYVTDGTVAGTVQISSAWGGLLQTELNGFSFYTKLNKLYKTNGTAAGTSEVLSNVPSFKFNGPALLMGNHLYFPGFDDTYKTELWKSNGNSNGFALVKDIDASTEDGVMEMAASTDNLYVSSNASYSFVENFVEKVNENKTVWKRNGTTGAFEAIKNFTTTIESYKWNIDNLKLLGSVSSKFFFEYKNLVSQQSELWMYDEILQTNTLITTFGGLGGLKISAFLPENINGHLFFVTRISNIASLYKLNLTTYQNTLVKQLDNGTDVRKMSRLNNDKVILNDFDRSLWVSDGTSSGTFPLMDNTGTINVVAPAFAGKIYFNYNTSNGIRDIWVTDGTTTGTQKLSVGAGSEWFNPNQFMVINNQLYFQYDSLGLNHFPADSYLVKINPQHQISTYKTPFTGGKIFPTDTKLMFYYGNNFQYFNLITNAFEQTTSPFILDNNLFNPSFSNTQKVCYYSSEPNQDLSVLTLSNLQKSDFKVGTAIVPGPRNFIEHKGILYFFARDYRGLELWQLTLSCEAAFQNIVNVTGTLANTQTIQANQVIIAPSSNQTNVITNTANIMYRAGNALQFNPGFEVQTGATFRAQIGKCQ